MAIMVTGGAGYIGAHVVDLLLKDGQDVVIVDNFCTGDRGKTQGCPVVEVDLSADQAPQLVADAMKEHQVTDVIHFAAQKQVGESAIRPAFYFKQNIGGMANLLEAMETAGVQRLVFSSSAAVYGDTVLDDNGALVEDTPCVPISPYGHTKHICEQMCSYAEAAWGLKWAGLRYFNVAGAGRPELGDPATLNLIPIILGNLAADKETRVFGNDYPTPDGTCLRDYVHVVDLADVHLMAMTYLSADKYSCDSPRILNVGRGQGVSVLEIVKAVEDCQEAPVPASVAERRPGDPATLVAATSRVGEVLGWKPEHDLASMVSSAILARKVTHSTAE